MAMEKVYLREEKEKKAGDFPQKSEVGRSE